MEKATATIIQRIQKLLSLSSSPNKAEAAAAAKKANELLVKYNLEIHDIENHSSEISWHLITHGFNPKSWRRGLLKIVAAVNFCQFIQVSRSNGGFGFFVVGKEHNAIITASMYEYLEKAITRISRATCHKNAKLKYRDHFKYGMATEICSRLIEQMEQFQATPDDKSIIALAYENEKREIDEYLKDFPLTSVPDEIKLKKIAYKKGLIAGKEVNLNKQINNTRVNSTLIN